VPRSPYQSPDAGVRMGTGRNRQQQRSPHPPSVTADMRTCATASCHSGAEAGTPTEAAHSCFGRRCRGGSPTGETPDRRPGVSGARAEMLAFRGCMAELGRRRPRTEAALGIPHGPCAAFRAPGRAAARRHRAHPPRSRRPPRRPARPRPRVGLRRPARRAVSGAFPRVRSASGRECSPQSGRPTGSASADERLDQLALRDGGR
jgi:hypothetical protein